MRRTNPDYSRWWAVAGTKHPQTTSLGVAYSFESAIENATRGARALNKTYTVWGYEYVGGGQERWDKLKTITPTQARKNPLPLAAIGAASTAVAMPQYVKGARSLAGDVRRFVRRNPEDAELAAQVSVGHIDFTDHGSIERYERDGILYHAFTSTPVFPDGYRMGVPIQYMEGPRLVVTNPTNRYRRRNPESTAADLYETFHGVPSTEIVEVVEDLHVHEHLGGLGPLVELCIVMPGQYKTTIKAPNPNGPDAVQVCGSEDGHNIYFRAGDQSIDVEALGFKPSISINHEGTSYTASQIKDSMLLGYVHKLTYRTEKKFDNLETIDYYHRCGEDTKKCPMLIYDTLNGLMSLAGGEYAITADGIVN